MAKSDQGSAMPEDSIAAMPVGEEIALAVDLPEKPDESIFLDSVSLEDFETELVRVPSFGKHKKKMHFTNGILIRVGTQELLVALISEWVTFTSAPQKFSRT